MEPIAPLARSVPLATILALADPGTVTGVWIDMGGRIVPLRMGVAANQRWISLLLSPDLGALLERAGHVVLERRGTAVLLGRDEVLRIRPSLTPAVPPEPQSRLRVAERTRRWPVDSPNGASIG